jgi:hypothetical protein
MSIFSSVKTQSSTSTVISGSPMINYHALLQSTLFSFNNGALYHRNGKASAQFLVTPFAQALVYLQAQNKPSNSLEKSVQLWNDTLDIDKQVRELGLTLQVAHAVDTLIKKGFLQPRK